MELIAFGNNCVGVPVKQILHSYLLHPEYVEIINDPQLNIKRTQHKMQVMMQES